MIVEDENGMTMFGFRYWALVGNGRAHFSPFTNGLGKNSPVGFLDWTGSHHLSVITIESLLISGGYEKGCRGTFVKYKFQFFVLQLAVIAFPILHSTMNIKAETSIILFFYFLFIHFVLSVMGMRMPFWYYWCLCSDCITLLMYLSYSGQVVLYICMNEALQSTLSRNNETVILMIVEI